MRVAAPATSLMAALAAILTAGAGHAQSAPEKDEAYLTVSYGLALGRCRGTLTLHPDGRFKASTTFGDKERQRSGKTDSVYWDLAVDVLNKHRVKDIKSIDAYYFTVPHDAPDYETRMAELEDATDYIILDGHAHTLDWRDEKGERVYLYDAKNWSRAMWQSLVRATRLEKMTCGHYLQQMFFP